jgi:hypothetical protein
MTIFWLAPLLILVLARLMLGEIAPAVVMTRSLRTETTRANLFYSAGGVALFLTPFMPGVWVTPSGADLLVMAAVGVAGFLSLLALDRMAAAAPVSGSAPLLYLQVAVTIAFLVAAGAGGISGRIAMGLLLIALIAGYAWSRERLLVVREDGVAGPAAGNPMSVRSLNTP